MNYQDQGQFRQLSQPSVDDGEKLFATPHFSQTKATIKDQLYLRQDIKKLSSCYHRNVSKEVTKSILKYYRNDKQKYKGFNDKKYYYSVNQTGDLFSVIYQNIDIILNQSRIFQNNCKEGSKQQYYSYWIIMRFDIWLQDKFPNN